MAAPCMKYTMHYSFMNGASEGAAAAAVRELSDIYWLTPQSALPRLNGHNVQIKDSHNTSHKVP